MADDRQRLVSIVIPSWNQRKLLSECLSSIVTVRDRVNVQTIVVDDASTDDTVAHVKEHFPAVSLIENSVNEGYARTVNTGAGLARGDFLFLLNNDIVLVDNTIDTLVAFLDEHPSVGAVAPLLFYPDGRLQVTCRRFPTPPALLLEHIGIDKIGPFRKWKLNPEEHVAALAVAQPMASALLVRRECWDRVGHMDERFPLFFNDVDWCYRLYRDTDYTIGLCETAEAVHHLGATVNTLGWKKKREFYRGLVRFYMKHFPLRNGIMK